MRVIAMDQARAGSSEKVVVGSRDNFWLWSAESGWDLTHPPSPEEPCSTTSRLVLPCEVSNATIDPAKTALVIVDMQNFSMHRAILGEDCHPAVLAAQDVLLQYTIPAARKANIQIVWLNWGVNDEQLKRITPGAMRVFGSQPCCEADDYGLFSRPAHSRTDKIVAQCQCGEVYKPRGPGTDLGEVVLEDGTTVDAGRSLMRDTWNAELFGPLLSAYQQGQAALQPDLWIHKDRNSGLYDTSCDFTQYLEKSGIRTLLFSGINTDQCVMATLQDAHSRGYDTIMLKDACATDSPDFAQKSAEYNCCINWGFLLSSKDLAHAVDNMS